MKRFISAAAALVALAAFAFEDEPDELNWNTLGGSFPGFRHFAAYCENNPGFKERLLAEKPLDCLDERLDTVWISAEAFTDAKIRQWEIREEHGETCLVGPGAHNGSMVRIGVEIPESGYYRPWVRYWHETNAVSAFGMTLTDGREADNPDASFTHVQDAYSWLFDWAEHARRGDPMPNHMNEPSGFVWEAAPTVWIKKGRKALSLYCTISGGPFAARVVNAVVFTREPLAEPVRPEGDGPVYAGKSAPAPSTLKLRDIWERRPIVVGGSERLRPLWREWKKAYIGHLTDTNALDGVEEKRMARTVYFDEEWNMIGTPQQVADGKKAFRNEIDAIEKAIADGGNVYKVKYECETFESDVKGEHGWNVEGGGNASGGAMLGCGYWKGECNARRDFGVPKSGTYNVWLRYGELPGYTAKFYFIVEDKAGGRLGELELGSDVEKNLRGGEPWVKLTLDLDAGETYVLRLLKNSGDKTSRHVDTALVTDDLEFVPQGIETIFRPIDKSRAVAVWRADPWKGHAMLTSPDPSDGLEKTRLEIREGNAETILLLVRNNTSATIDATPRIEGDAQNLLNWRVPAYTLSGFGWTPQPLLRREQFFVAPDETAGIWINVEGLEGFSDENISVSVGDQTFEIEVVRKEPYPADLPVPYVYGWSNPYNMVSCWELYKRLGINCIGDMLVPKSEADEYGIKLTLHLNDSWMDDSHIQYVIDRFKKMGYDYPDWTWSFMDEPPKEAVWDWVEMAMKMKEFDPEVRLWVNPGEADKESPGSVIDMLPYVSNFCPYINHFGMARYFQPYADELSGNGDSHFDIFMYYTTPCFAEKAPGAPNDLLGMWGMSIGLNLDGWAFFALHYGFPYSNSLWDEINNFIGDQCVNIYPGANLSAISTRNAEAIREAVRYWREAKLAQREKKE